MDGLSEAVPPLSVSLTKQWAVAHLNSSPSLTKPVSHRSCAQNPNTGPAGRAYPPDPRSLLPPPAPVSADSHPSPPAPAIGRLAGREGPRLLRNALGVAQAIRRRGVYGLDNSE